MHDPWLRWLVTGLAVLSAAEWVHVIVVRRRTWTLVLSYALHLVMAIAMVVMAWPVGAHLPPTGPAVFFGCAAAWFVAMTIVWARTPLQRVLRCYHALMALAMTWMYAAMPHLHMVMPMDTDMDMDMGPPGWVTASNWFWLVVFAVATDVWAYLAIARWRNARTRLMYGLGQTMMAAAMAITLGDMLFAA